jgi:hypothetical protein
MCSCSSRALTTAMAMGVTPMRMAPPGAQAGLKRKGPGGNSSTTVEPSRKRPISAPRASVRSRSS